MEPNILIIQVAEAGGMACDPNITEIIYRQYLDEEYGHIKAVNNYGDYVIIDRTPQITTNIDGFNFKEAYKILLKNIDYYGDKEE